jgi:hypothetical protein
MGALRICACLGETLPVATNSTGASGAGGEKVGNAVGVELGDLDAMVLGCAEGVVCFVCVRREYPVRMLVSL